MARQREAKMTISGIKSRPVYRLLAPDLGGRHHVLVAQGSGGAAIVRLLDAMPPEADIQVMYARESLSGNDYSEALAARGLVDLRVFATQAEAVAAVDQSLVGSVMGTRLYIAGSESFIGAAVQVAMKFNMNADEVQCEHSGNRARRVYCIHCQFVNVNVTTNIVKCLGCGRHLAVRDHYSRRLGSYMGVMADAETPGELPPIVEVFA
jgi:hypothetical protein